MAKFEIAYAITREIEGGYHAGTGVNAADRGGETFKGIARKMWPSWGGWKTIDILKRERNFPQIALEDKVLGRMVLAFYKMHFWDTLRLDHVTSQAIANEVFDSSVNCGAMTAARWLQRGINLVSRPESIAVDGKIGAVTIGRLNGLNTINTILLFDVLNIIQGAHYIDITEKDPSQEVFLRGWMVRVELMKS